jgi:peroxiredoxin
MTLKVGQPAADFALSSHDEQLVRLSDYREQRNLVLAFFPLAWTPI